MHQPTILLIWVICLASILCMLLRPGRIAEVYWVCGGALLLVTMRLIPMRQATAAVYEGLDVYLFLTGMMVLAEMAREERVFDWAAGIAAGHANGSQPCLFELVYLVGIAVTALLSNDATAVVLTPAVLAVVRRAKISPRPYLLACAFVANAASFIFPISNPANLVVFGKQIPPLLPWLRIFFLPSLGSILVTFLCLRWHARGELGEPITEELHTVQLSTEGKLALAGLLLAAGALIGSSVSGLPLGTPTCLAAFAALIVVSTRNRKILPSVVKGVSWSVLPLVAGLFVIVQALHGAGLLRVGLLVLRGLSRMPFWAAKSAPAFGFAIVSNLMNNLPVALISRAAIAQAHESGPVSHAILLGVDLGPAPGPC